MEPLDRLKGFLELILTPSLPVFAAGALVVLLVPVLLHFYLYRATANAGLPSVLLLGPSGAGKTALLTLFERSASTSTRTSQTPAQVELAVSEDGTSGFRDDLDAAGGAAKKFLLVDTPGYGKLRGTAEARLARATKLRAVVFVVDGGALAEPEGVAAAASYLYDVLLFLQKRAGSGRGSKAPPAVPVLIAANKADLFTALPAALVRSSLEAELARIRTSRSRGLLDSGVGADDVDAAQGDGWLGEYGAEKFSFAQMLEFDVEVDIAAGNVTGDGPGADKWWSWIADKI